MLFRRAARPRASRSIRAAALGVALVVPVRAARAATQRGPRPATRVRGDSTAVPLTLGAAVARAMNANPDVVLARLRLDSARAERTIARALPNPSVSATPGVPSQYAVQLPLDIGPERLYRTRSSALGASAAERDLTDVERQVAFAVRSAFVDLLLADSLQGVAEEQARTYRQLLAADSLRLATGSIAERDVVTTRLQLAHAEAALARAVVASHEARFTLETAMGMTTPDSALHATGALRYAVVSLPNDSAFTSLVGRRADVAAAALRVRQSEAVRSFVRASLIPMPTIGVAWQPAQPYASGLHYAPAVGLTLPILSLGAGERARAAAGIEAARLTAARTRLQARMDVGAALDAYRSARVLAQRYECGLLADAAGALEAARYAYGRGATSLLELLDAVRTYGDTRTDYLTAAHDYWVSVFALERATGEELVPDELPALAPAAPGTGAAPACAAGRTASLPTR